MNSSLLPILLVLLLNNSSSCGDSCTTDSCGCTSDSCGCNNNTALALCLILLSCSSCGCSSCL
ncbi:MAG: hypothetical protein R3Y23_04240 [Bacillota bacterium]